MQREDVDVPPFNDWIQYICILRQSLHELAASAAASTYSRRKQVTAHSICFPWLTSLLFVSFYLTRFFAPKMCLFLGCISHSNMFNTAFQILYILHSASALYFFCHSILAVKCAISATSGNVVKGDLCDLPFFYNGVRYVHVGCARACVHTSYTHT